MGCDVVFVLPAHYLVSSADVQAVAERDGFGGVGFALPFGTSFEVDWVLFPVFYWVTGVTCD